jgi:hypothetical protein
LFVTGGWPLAGQAARLAIKKPKIQPMPRIALLLLFALFFSNPGYSQCRAAPAPPACTGSEALVVDGETISSGVTKWYYGPGVMLNTLTLDGGTLVVCSTLTIDKFYMNAGTIFIRPGGKLVITAGIGSGIQFKGNCAIYNYGTCEIQRNLTLENNATPATPNLVVNATSSSVFKMSNQYMVVSNNSSWFVNNGYAEFWGIITDVQSSAGSVCLGGGSTTKMAILINKVANTYTAPSGNACVNVFQYSEFYGKLTSDPTVFVCLGPGHTSNSSCIPFGCAPNNWGQAQVFTNCAACGAIAVLQVEFVNFSATYDDRGFDVLRWETGSPVNDGSFAVLRSADGVKFQLLDSVSPPKAGNSVFNYIDKHPLQGNNYYMIRFTRKGAETVINSKVMKTFFEKVIGFNLYPTPFDRKFYINCPKGTYPLKILLTDMSGHNIRTKYVIRGVNQPVEVTVLDPIETGVYLVHVQTDKNVSAKTIFKR